MNAYYGNIMSAGVSAGMSADPFYFSPDMVKFESANCYSGGSAGQPPGPSVSLPGFDHGSNLQHAGFSRFSPFDVRASSVSSKSQAAYSSTYPVGGTTGSSAYTCSNGPSNQPFQGHYLDPPGLGNCKLVSDPAIGMMSVGPGAVNSQMTGVMPPYSSGNFGSVLPSQTAGQNLPIYPWMRSIGGGKCLYTTSSYHNYNDYCVIVIVLIAI